MEKKEIVKNIAEEISPIIIIPGTMHSKLYDEKGLGIWPPTPLSILKFQESLKIENNVYTTNMEQRNQGADHISLIDQTKVEKKEYGIGNSYKEMIDELMKKFPNTPIYFFGYDFRRSIVDLSDSLKDRIYEIKKLYPRSKVNLVCHSMGGLIASAYVAKNLITYKVYVDKIITMGTPYEGAALSLYTLESGQILKDDHEQPIVIKGKCENYLSYSARKIIRFSNIQLKLKLDKEVIKDIPGIWELIPTPDYYRENSKLSGDVIFNNNKYVFQDEKIYLNYLHNMEKRLGAKGQVERVIEIQNLLKRNGENILASLSNTYFGYGNINNSNKNNSIHTLLIEPAKYRYKKNIKGDGTVSVGSATMNKKILLRDRVKCFKELSHSELIKGKSLEWIIKILDNKYVN